MKTGGHTRRVTNEKTGVEGPEKYIKTIIYRCLFQRMAPTSVGIHSNIIFNFLLLSPFPFQVQAYLESVLGMYNTSHWPCGAPW